MLEATSFIFSELTEILIWPAVYGPLHKDACQMVQEHKSSILISCQTRSSIWKHSLRSSFANSAENLAEVNTKLFQERKLDFFSKAQRFRNMIEKIVTGTSCDHLFHGSSRQSIACGRFGLRFIRSLNASIQILKTIDSFSKVSRVFTSA